MVPAKTSESVYRGLHADFQLVLAWRLGRVGVDRLDLPFLLRTGRSVRAATGTDPVTGKSAPVKLDVSRRESMVAVLSWLKPNGLSRWDWSKVTPRRGPQPTSRRPPPPRPPRFAA